MGLRAQHTFYWLVTEENLSARAPEIGRWYLSTWFPSHPQRTLQMLSRLFYVIVDPHGKLSELEAVDVGGIECVYDLQEALKKKHSEIARYKLMLHHIDAETFIEAEAMSKDLSKYRCPEITEPLSKFLDRILPLGSISSSNLPNVSEHVQRPGCDVAETVLSSPQPPPSSGPPQAQQDRQREKSFQASQNPRVCRAVAETVLLQPPTTYTASGSTVSLTHGCDACYR